MFRVPKNGVIDTREYLYVVGAGIVHQFVEYKLPGRWLKMASIKKGELFGSFDSTSSECKFVAKCASLLYRIHQEQFLAHFDRMEVQAHALMQKRWLRE